MMLENHSTAGINITQDVPHGDYPDRFTRLLCSKKDWRIMQPMKARSNDDPVDKDKIE